MHKDILRESWVFQEILQEGSEQTRQVWIQREREMLLEIISNRFPQLSKGVMQQIEHIVDPEVLKQAIIAASTEQNASAFTATLS